MVLLVYDARPKHFKKIAMPQDLCVAGKFPPYLFWLPLIAAALLNISKLNVIFVFIKREHGI